MTRAPSPGNGSKSEPFSGTMKRLARPIDAITLRRAASQPAPTSVRLPPNSGYTLPRRRL